MREALTDQLTQALAGAQQQARGLNQEFVGTEHLLLGLLSAAAGDDDTEALAGLKLAGVERDALRKRLTESLPRAEQSPGITGDLPLSPNAQRAINAAVTNAQSTGSPRVSTRMLLVALLDECQTLVRPAMRAVGADLDHLQRVLVQDGTIQPEA
jgi:ATP-dependent Clp protease ATP-binding subunit ClpC